MVEEIKKMILILGSKGMLGQQLLKVFGSEAVGWDRDDVDVTQIKSLKLKVESLNLSAIINCVAYNDVDGAESNKEAAFLLNEKVPADLSEICNELDIPLVHFSTNYVFDGEKGYYNEDDFPKPLSVYGKSKLAGEQAVQKKAKKYYLIRTSVLFGPKGQSLASKKSFIELMLELSYRQDFVAAIEDEFNSLTYCPDLAWEVKKFLEGGFPYGLYHITNSGRASWYDFALEIFKIYKPGFLVKPVLSQTFKRAALRPKSAVLISNKLAPLRPWPEALREYLNQEV